MYQVNTDGQVTSEHETLAEALAEIQHQQRQWVPSRPIRHYNVLQLCSECGQYPADEPSSLCQGCAAYLSHTGWL